jgi:tellurite resistance protein TehA-like permease
MRNAKRSIDVTETRVIDPEVGERRRWMMMMGAPIGLSAVVSHQSREARPRLKYTTDILSIFAFALLILLLRLHLLRLIYLKRLT